MKRKANKKASVKISKSDDLLAEAMFRLRNKKVLFPEQVERARKSMRNVKFEGL